VCISVGMAIRKPNGRQAEGDSMVYLRSGMLARPASENQLVRPTHERLWQMIQVRPQRIGAGLPFTI
jgi:hypothetical protein